MYQLLRNADVNVRKLIDETGTHAHITVDGKYEHVFPAKSRLSDALGVMTTEELSQKLTGGSFFYVEDKLIDFRDVNYVHNGFQHTDAAIDSLMEVIGFRDVTKARKSAHRMTNRTSSNTISLSKVWDQQEIVVPHYQQGGGFDSQLSYLWNPFQKHITTQFELVRQICSNGMVALTPFINMNIPLVNRWQEHLNIANCQLQNKISNTMTKRLGEMAEGRCTVADAMILHKHVMGRLNETHNTGERERLVRIEAIVDPFTHLAPYYKAEVFDNKMMAAQVPAHLSMFDAWNIATEVCQHTNQNGASSDAGLQKLANGLVFDRECATERVAHIGKNIDLSPFSSPERAFFGELAVD